MIDDVPLQTFFGKKTRCAVIRGLCAFSDK